MIEGIKFFQSNIFKLICWFIVNIVIRTNNWDIANAIINYLCIS